MVDTIHRPATLADLSKVVREAKKIRLLADDPFLVASCEDAERVSLAGLTGVVEHQVADQIVVVRAGIRLSELNALLAASGQCVPVLPCVANAFANVDWLLSPVEQPVGHAASMALPHALEAQCGAWRDWILGMTVVLADGTIAKCGSKVVKNVAGYDAQKLFIGARGTLGVVAELILRTYPVRALPIPQVEVFAPLKVRPSDPVWIQRTLASDFPAAIRNAANRLIAADHATRTLWAVVPRDAELPRFDGDWVLRSACGDKNLPKPDSTHLKFMRRAKELFDPTHKLNSGELVIS